MQTHVRSYSKINLGLAIGPPRPDGFHGLATLYQTLALHDIVTVEARPAPETRITLTTNHSGVPTDSRNTAWKIVDLALARLNLHAEVKINIQKDLPVQGGLGAGSANAAAALHDSYPSARHTGGLKCFCYSPHKIGWSHPECSAFFSIREGEPSVREARHLVLFKRPANNPG